MLFSLSLLILHYQMGSVIECIKKCVGRLLHNFFWSFSIIVLAIYMLCFSSSPVFSAMLIGTMLIGLSFLFILSRENHH